MTAKILAACAPVALIICAGVGLWCVQDVPPSPADLPALADTANAAGWRVVPVARSNGAVQCGFFAVPPDDPRGWEELARLRVGESGWDGAVLCLPMWNFAEPWDAPNYSCRGYMLYGEPGGVREFADLCRIK